MEALYIQGTLKRKLQLLGFLAICFSLILAHSIIMPYILTGDSRNDLLNITYVNIIVFTALLPAYVTAALYSYRFGRKVHISQQYPPPGAEMPFTTKIVKGKQALIQAYASYCISLIIMSFSILNLGYEVYFSLILNGHN